MVSFYLFEVKCALNSTAVPLLVPLFLHTI